MPRKDAYTGPISAQAQQDLVSEGIENYELPKSIVMKIAKSSVPDNVKLQKETVLSLVKGSTVFLSTTWLLPPTMLPCQNNTKVYQLLTC